MDTTTELTHQNSLTIIDETGMEVQQAIVAPSPLEEMPDLLTYGLRESSIEVYRDSLKRYLTFTQERGLNPLDDHSLEQWRDYFLLETGNKPSTINREMAAIVRLVKELVIKRRIDERVYTRFQLIPRVKPKARVGALEEQKVGTRITIPLMRKICDSPDPDTLLGLRDRALLLTLATSGVRCGEAGSLMINHIQERDGEPSQHDLFLVKEGKMTQEELYEKYHGYIILVCGKTDKKLRPAPLSHEAYDRIQTWLAARPVESPYVFTSFTTSGLKVAIDPTTGKPTFLSEKSIWKLVKTYGKRCGVNITTHDFRRFVGSQLMLVNPADANKALGHKKMDTTLRYDLNDLKINLTNHLL